VQSGNRWQPRKTNGQKTGSVRSPSDCARDVLGRSLPYESIGHVVTLYALGFVLLLHEGQLIVAKNRILAWILYL